MKKEDEAVRRATATADGRPDRDWAARLEQNLREQIAAEERLVVALGGQKEAMRRCSAEGLKEALRQSEAAARAAAEVAGQRRRMLEACAADIHTPPTWDAIVPHLPADRQPTLRALRDRAKDLARQAADVNGVNGRVTQRAVAHFAGLFTVIAGAGAGTYAPAGKQQVAVKTAGTSALIDRVA